MQRSKRTRKKDFPVGLTLFLVLITFFMFRFVKIALSKEVRGNLAYIQMLNAGIPMVKGVYNNEDAYAESTVSVESLVIETLGIDKINPENILASQIPGFDKYNEMAMVDNVEGEKEESLDSFVLDDSSIGKQEIPNPGTAPAGVRNPDIVQTLDQSKPRVLLYHTHTDEGYSVDRHFTSDTSKNVVGVGELVAKELEEYYGISVIHDKTNHSTSYETSYDRSRETVQMYADKYNSFDLIVDLHRDSISNPDRKSVTTANINGEDLAKIMFVDTRNSANFENTNAIHNRMLANANELFPGLSRDIRTVNKGIKRYNQDIMLNTILIEVGAEYNTGEEAQNTAKYIARLIAEELASR